MRTVARSLCLVMAFGLASAPRLPAAPDAGQAAQQMVTAFDAAQYEETVRLAELFIKDHPKSPNLPSAYLLLARSQFFLGRWADSVASYALVRTSTQEKDILEEAGHRQPKALAAQADALDPKDPQRSKLKEESLQKISEFLKEYPASSETAEIRLLQASLSLELGRYAESSQALDAARKADQNQDLGEDVDYMQAFAESRRAEELLADFKNAEAEAALARAGQMYGRLAKSENPAMAAQANLQLAGLDLTAKRYDQAIDRLRSIPGKEELLARLESKIAPLRAEVARATKPPPDKQRRLQREQKKIDDVRAQPDISAQALFQLGSALLQTRRLDEARLIFRHVARFAPAEFSGPADQQVILTYALQGRSAEADRLLAEYQKKFPNQKGVAGMVDFLTGRFLLEEGKTQEAIRRLESAQEKAAGERLADEITRFIGTAYEKAGQRGEAIRFYEKFLADVAAGKKKVSPESAEQTRLLLAGVLAEEKRAPEALTQLKELAASAQTPAVRETAALRIGSILRAEGRPVEAAEAFAQFAANFPKSPNLDNALMNRGDCLVEAKQSEAGLAAWRQVATQFKGSPAGLEALERIWRTHAREKKTDLMLAVQEEQLREYPREPRNLGALVNRGAVFAEARDEAQALQAYRRAFELYRSLYPDPSTSPPPVAVSDTAFLALERAADLETTRARALGAFSGLSEADRRTWKECLDRATDNLSQAILGYSTPRVASTLSKLVSLCLLRFQSGELDVEACLQPFRDLAAKAGNRPGLVAQILFAQASVPFEGGQTDLALRLYQSAYRQSLETKAPLDWRDLERFGRALLGAGKNEEARPVFERIQQEFPASGAKDPKLFAQASALFGLGMIDFQSGNKEGAEKRFRELAEKYPWSEKIQEANFLRGQSLASAGKFDGSKEDPGAFDLWTSVIESTRGSNEIKARAMLAFGKSLEEIAAKKTPTRQLEQGGGKPPLDPLDLAAEYYLKVDLFYDSLPELSAEGMAQAARIRRAQQKNDEARKILTRLLEKYGNTSAAAEAATMLKSLPPPAAPQG